MMLLQVFCIDENVIHVNNDTSFINKFLIEVIHHSLEGGRTIGKTKEHDKWLKQTSIGSKGCLPFITFLHSDIVVTPPNIKFGEVLGFTELVYQFRNERQGICILNGHVIELPIVLNQSQGAIFLLDKEDWGCHWGFGRSDPSTFQVLI